MGDSDDQGDRGGTASTAAHFKGGAFDVLRRRQAEFEHIRGILSEIIDDIVSADGYTLDIAEDGVLELIVRSPAEADLLRQAQPLIKEALAPEGFPNVRLRNSRS